MPEALSPQTALLLLPLFLHFGLVAFLYMALTRARLVTVRRGEARKGDFARADGDAALSARFQRNLANQFEAPVFAWLGAGVLILTAQVNTLDVAAAWLFLVGRIAHSIVQCSGDNVALRGQVFIVNFAAVVWLMGHAGLAVGGILLL